MSGSQFAVGNSNTAKIYHVFDGKGNVGIGTTNPATTLQVNGQIQSATSLSGNIATLANSTAQTLFTNSNLSDAAGSGMLNVNVRPGIQRRGGLEHRLLVLGPYRRHGL